MSCSVWPDKLNGNDKSNHYRYLERDPKATCTGQGLFIKSCTELTPPLLVALLLNPPSHSTGLETGRSKILTKFDLLLLDYVCKFI